MKWFVVFITFGLMACGSDSNKMESRRTTKDISNADSTIIIDSKDINTAIAPISPVISVSDSLYIAKKLIELNAEYYSEWCEGREQDCDSLGGWESDLASVIYSQDSFIRFYNFMGVWEGAYPVPISCVYNEFGQEVGEYLYPIKSIAPISGDMVLIIGRGTDRPRGIEYRTGVEAHYYNLHSKKSLKITEAILSMLVENTDGQKFKIQEPNIEYNSSTKSLKTLGFGYYEIHPNGGNRMYYQVKSEYKLKNYAFELVRTDTIKELRTENF